MTHEEANWRLSLTQPSGYSNSFSSGNEGKATRDDLHRKDWDGSSLRTLLVLVAIAMTWAYRCASRVMGVRGIPKKSHGRREKSWFRIGFDTLRRWILHDPEKALHAWRKTCPKRSLLNPDRNGILE